MFAVPEFPTTILHAIAASNGIVYAGGAFTNVKNNGVVLPAADYIARWDGTHWYPLGSNGVGSGSLNDAVLGLAIDQRTVYISGYFSEANNNGTLLKNAAHIAAYVEETPPPAAPSFSDVPTGHPYYRDIEILYAHNLTGGCQTSPLKFCPDQVMNRAQAAAFMLRGSLGSSYVPDPATHIFKDDWTKGSWAEAWAEGMRSNGFSAGCFAGPLKYCPWDQIPREQAVIFALRLKYGPFYTPPPATGTVFADMKNPSYYVTAWVEQAYKEGIIPSCERYAERYFCPKDLVSRGLAAHMIVRAKGLTMP